MAIHIQRKRFGSAFEATGVAEGFRDPKYVGLEYEGKEVHAVPQDRPGQLPYCGCHNKSVLIFLDED